jgi:hypothetical protein
MPQSPRRLALSALAVAAAFATAHCQRDAEAPAATTDAGCCEVTPNAALAAGMGRIVVSYPGGDGAASTRLDVFAAGDASKAVESKYGDAALELAPGTYDATVGGRRVAGVGVQAAHDTRIRVGVLSVHASDGTRIDLVEPANGEKLASGYGEKQYGLPIGLVAVEVAGQRDTALVEDGKVTEF